jgi:hypothetical protein
MLPTNEIKLLDSLAITGGIDRHIGYRLQKLLRTGWKIEFNEDQCDTGFYWVNPNGKPMGSVLEKSPMVRRKATSQNRVSVELDGIRYDSISDAIRETKIGYYALLRRAKRL